MESVYAARESVTANQLSIWYVSMAQHTHSIISKDMQEIAIQAIGTDLYAQQRSPHPHAVFLHGFGGDLHTWDSVWEVLGDGVPALRYDLRGFGRSVCRENLPYNHADDLLLVLDATSIERFDLIGVSMGGSIALNFTLDHPERVRSLTLISPGLTGWQWSDAWRELWRPIVDHARSGAMSEAKRLWWEHPLFNTTRAGAAGPALFESIMRYSGAQWISDSHVLMLPDVERLHLLKTPTLLLTGGRDLDDFRLIADLIEVTASRLERSDDPARGHLLHLEDPVECARKIKLFLSLE
jgi:pimeloyl-ACP methyl ester carboxylesterase